MDAQQQQELVLENLKKSQLEFTAQLSELQADANNRDFVLKSRNPKGLSLLETH